MATETLTINNVNLDKLEGQRTRLNSVLTKIDKGQINQITSEEVFALGGIGAMLDYWSDMRWAKSRRKK